MRRILPAILLAALLVSCRKGGPVQVTGDVRWQADRLLSPGAELTLQLADVTRADAAPRIVATAKLSGLALSPYHFAVPVDTAGLDRHARYAVLARVDEDGRAALINRRRFEIDSAHPLAPVEVTVEPVPRSIDADNGPPGLPPPLAAMVERRARLRSVAGTLGSGPRRADWTAWFDGDSLCFIAERAFDGDAGARNVVYGFAGARLACVRARGWQRAAGSTPPAPVAVALDWDGRGRGRGGVWTAGRQGPARPTELEGALARAAALRQAASRPKR